MANKQAVKGERGRWSVKAKRAEVLRWLRGETIDARYNVPPHQAATPRGMNREWPTGPRRDPLHGVGSTTLTHLSLCHD